LGPVGLALALHSNSKTFLVRVSKDKLSSLLGLIVSSEAPVVLLAGLELSRDLVQLLLPLGDDLVEVFGALFKLNGLQAGAVHLK
jgi:hypothetical protein